jgi:hypothetical protein
LDTFWLKIEQFWLFEDISIFSNSGHLEWRAGLSDTVLKGTHAGLPKLCPLIPTSNQDGHQAINRKKGDDILIVHCCFSTILEGTHPRTIPARFGLIWFTGFRGEDLNVIFYQNMPNLHSRYISAEIFSSATAEPN